MMIDPMSSNDPYAQRVYVVAKCDECFLEKKKKEFNERIAMLQSEQDLGNDEEIEYLKKAISSLREELKQYAYSEDIAEFSRSIIRENDRYWNKNSPAVFNNPKEAAEYIAPGAYAAPFPFDKEQRI